MGTLHRAQRHLLLDAVIATGPGAVEPHPLQEPVARGPQAPVRGLRLCSQLALGAGLVAIVIQLLSPFDHGVWLIAYLLLVGSLAPYLLATGEEALLARRSAARIVNVQPSLWGAGTIAVPAGVLLDSRLLVALGSIALLTALASMASAGLARRPRPSTPARTRLESAYGALIVFMTVSVGIGLALAWNTPWV